MLRFEVLEGRENPSGSPDVPAVDLLEGISPTAPVVSPIAIIGGAAGAVAGGAQEQQPVIAPPAEPFIGPPYIPGSQIP